MIIHNPILTGSFSVNGADLSTITGSVATSASFDARTTYLESTSSILTAASASQSVTSGSLVAASASLSATSGSLSAASGSFNTRVSALEVTGSALSSSLLTVSGSGYATSGSLNTRVSALEVTGSALSSSLLTVSGSGYATSASLSTASGSFNSRTTNLETYTTNWTAVSASFARTGSNTFTAPQYVSDLTVANGFANSSASVYTDGGLLVAKDSYFSGSMFIKGNLTIYGTQSVAYITSSQLNIATNVITVNTATPSVRFGGLNVYDSGSTGTGATGSLFWDSQNNGWVYQRESGSTYSGGMLISGPRRALGTNLGDEQGLTACMIPVAQGGDHITSSLIYHDSSITCILNAAYVNSTFVAKGSSTFCDTVGLFGSSPQLYIGATAGASDYSILGWCSTCKYLNIHQQSVGNAPQLVIACNGKVGVGTCYPSSILNVSAIDMCQATTLATAYTAAKFRIDTYLTSGQGISMGNISGYQQYVQAQYQDLTTTNPLMLNPFGGIVGIGTGTNNPSSVQKLFIQSNNDQAGITMYNSYDCNMWGFATGTEGINNKGFAIRDNINNATRLQIDNSGNIGIGTLIPCTKLTVLTSNQAQDVYVPGLKIHNEGNGNFTGYGTGIEFQMSSDYPDYKKAEIRAIASSAYANSIDLTFWSGGSSSGVHCERMRITSGGNIGIGTTAPNAQLDAYTSQGGSTIAATHGTGGSYPKASGISFGATSTSLTVSNNGGNTTFTGGAGIYASNGAASNNPTDLVFWTTSAGSPTARLTIASTGAATFSSTITGTTIYGSTAVCSPVGYFSGCVGVGFTGYGGSKLTLVASTNPTCASSANMQLSIGEASQNTTYSFKLGYIYVGGGYVGAIQTIAGGVASTTLINPDGGNVGIGTSGPQSSYKVTISGTDTVYPSIYLENTTNSQAYSIRATGTNFAIRDNSSGNDRITLTNTGGVCFACPLSVPRVFERSSDLTNTCNMTGFRSLNIAHMGSAGYFDINPASLFGLPSQGGMVFIQITTWQRRYEYGIINWQDNGSNVPITNVTYTTISCNVGSSSQIQICPTVPNAGTDCILRIYICNMHNNGHGYTGMIYAVS